MPLASVDAGQAIVIDALAAPMVELPRARISTFGGDGGAMSTAYPALSRRPLYVRPSSSLALLTPELSSFVRSAGASSSRAGRSWRTSAATPVACGAANDVPEISDHTPGQISVLGLRQRAAIASPGAARSTHEPRLENPATAPSGPIAPNE